MEHRCKQGVLLSQYLPEKAQSVLGIIMLQKASHISQNIEFATYLYTKYYEAQQEESRHIF